MDNEQRKAKEIQDEYERILEEAKQAYDRERVRFNKQILAPTSIGPVDPSVRTEHVEYNPNVVTDPNSWLNKGLGNLAGSVADVVLGQPSGNDIVDMGVANVPYVGAGAILAAGGMPGAVDVVGLPALKNMSKIPKYTYEFVSKYFGPRGLANLDNALTKYPKAGKPSVNDAVTIMREGIGGDVVPAIAPYRSTDMDKDVMTMLGLPDMDMQDYVQQLFDGVTLSPALAKELDNEVAYLNKALETQNYNNAVAGIQNLTDIVKLGTEGKLQSASIKDVRAYFDDLHKSAKKPDFLGTLYKGNIDNMDANDREVMRRYMELESSPVQDWDKIIQSQERRDAKNALKEAKKAEKEAMVATEPEPVAIVEEPVDNRPQWQKNGWKSDVRSPEWYSRVGRNMSEDSKRDFYGVDSLARHWAGKIQPQKGFLDANIIGGKARAEARHDLTNYNNIAAAFRKDIQRNIESGNIPGSAVQLLQRFKNNKPVEGKTTPTLVLRLNERPRALPDVNVYADEAQGPDLYELLFRPRVDKVLHDANPGYYLLR
jgi:hypothetical protein